MGGTAAPCKSLNCHCRVSVAGVKRSKRCCTQPALPGLSQTRQCALSVHGSGLLDFHLSVFQNSVLNSPHCKMIHFCAWKHGTNRVFFSPSFTCPVSLIYPHLGTHRHQNKICLLQLCWYLWDLRQYWFG